jgi:hypothetical protein
MWDIHSATELSRKMSASAGPDELLRRLTEHVRRSVHVKRAVLRAKRMRR